MEHFTPWSALIGGAIIGLSSSLFYWGLGRSVGISGIWGDLFGSFSWVNFAFVAGLIGAGVVANALSQPGSFFEPFFEPVGYSKALMVSGLLVGFGTRLGNGCTSGHGVCGLSRFSFRSLIAVLVFMVAGMITVYFRSTFFRGST